MKPIKTLTAFILSLSLLPAFIACKDEETLLPSTGNSEESLLPENSAEESAPPSENEPEETPDAPSQETPPVSTPTVPETPSTPSAPSTPSTPSTPQTPVVSTKAQYIRLTGDSVNLRKGAGTNYTVLTSSKQGTVYALIEKSGSWYKTYYRNQVAYVHTSYAAVLSLEKSETDKVEDVVAEGYKLLGTPYVYGAVRLHDGTGKMLSNFSVHKFDCSSLIQYIFYKGAGKLLNVNTRTQVKQGKYVKPSDLQRGDCIFFTNEERQYNTGVERIGHVALYLGNNYILHTASDYACIEQISAKRWSFYVEARRFI
ncbi:MAG: C40 family peptidase [Clostridia bacterium]|nr:C40 family peptidase [Clostridia bacterium]